MPEPQFTLVARAAAVGLYQVGTGIGGQLPSHLRGSRAVAGRRRLPRPAAADAQGTQGEARPDPLPAIGAASIGSAVSRAHCEESRGG